VTGAKLPCSHHGRSGSNGSRNGVVVDGADADGEPSAQAARIAAAGTVAAAAAARRSRSRRWTRFDDMWLDGTVPPDAARRTGER